jgi:hypothetical protein
LTHWLTQRTDFKAKGRRKSKAETAFIDLEKISNSIDFILLTFAFYLFPFAFPCSGRVNLF